MIKASYNWWCWKRSVVTYQIIIMHSMTHWYAHVYYGLYTTLTRIVRHTCITFHSLQKIYRPHRLTSTWERLTSARSFPVLTIPPLSNSSKVGGDKALRVLGRGVPRSGLRWRGRLGTPEIASSAVRLLEPPSHRRFLSWIIVLHFP